MISEAISVARLLRMLATVGAALVMIVILSSAYLRLTQAGLSCDDWPTCYGRIGTETVITGEQRFARLAHRIAATAVAAVLLALALVAWTQRPVLLRPGLLVLVCLVIAGGLAVLGVATPGARLPVVTLGNLGGGFTLLALLWWLRLDVASSPPLLSAPPLWLRLIAVATLAALVAQIALGTMVSANFAALACPAFPGCGADWPAGALSASLDPWRELVLGDDGAVVRPPALAALHIAHRIGAATVVTMILVLTARLLYSGGRARRFGAILLVLVLMQAALGAGAVLAQLPLTLVVAHNAVAALLLAALVALNHGINASGDMR
jgi:heme a synthase